MNVIVDSFSQWRKREIDRLRKRFEKKRDMTRNRKKHIIIERIRTEKRKKG